MASPVQVSAYLRRMLDDNQNYIPNLFTAVRGNSALAIRLWRIVIAFNQRYGFLPEIKDVVRIYDSTYHSVGGRKIRLPKKPIQTKKKKK